MASTAPDAITALLALLDGSTGLSGVRNDWSPPPPDRLGHEHIWIGEFDVDEDPQGFGRHIESYELPVVISVGRGGYDQAATETRAWALAATVEQLVRDNEQLGRAWSNTHFAADTAGKRRRAFPTPAPAAGWACEVTVRVAIEAHI